MIKRTITILAALMSASIFGSPAATRAWVTNYVNNAVSNVVVNQRNISVVSTDFESNGTNGYMVVTFGDGSVKRFPYKLEFEDADIKGFMVANSSINGLNNGVYYAYDYLNSEYRNNNLAREELVALKSSIYTSTNGVYTCEQLTATNSITGAYFYTISTSTNTSYGASNSNILHLVSVEYLGGTGRGGSLTRARGGMAYLLPVKLTKTEARILGVTNFLSTAFFNSEPPRTFVSYCESFSEILSSLFVPAAYADIAPTPSETSTKVTLHANISQIEGEEYWYPIPITLSYSGPWKDWPAIGYPTPDKYHEYVPNPWPYQEDWNNYDQYWFHFSSGEFSITYKYFLSAEDQREGILRAQVTSPINEPTFKRVFCNDGVHVTPLDFIPKWYPPWLVEYDKVWNCKEKGHFWGVGKDACVCSVCSCFRQHHLTGGDGNTCDTCDNHFGPEHDPEDRMCGLTHLNGGSDTPSDISHHGGWRDADEKEGNPELCQCQCEDWNLLHLQGGDVSGSTWKPGMYDEQSGQIITTTDAKEEYHYINNYCIRGRDGVKCESVFYYNEGHDWNYSDMECFPVYRTADGKPHVAYTAEQKSAYESDPTIYMFDPRVHAICPKCSKCKYVARRPNYEPHEPTVGNNDCFCQKCQHGGAHTDGYVDQCVNAIYNYWSSMTIGENYDFTPYCLNCKWQYELSKADAERHSVDGEKGGYGGEAIGRIDTKMPAEKQAELHVCGCGLIEEEHYDDNGDRFCDVNCGYRFPYASGNGKRDEEDDSESEIAFPENEESPDPQKDSPLPSPDGKPELSPEINTPEPPPSAPMPSDIPSIDIDWGPTNAILVAVMRGDWYVADPDRKEETEALGTSAHPYVELVFQIYDNDGELLPGFVTIKYVFDFGMIGPLPSEMSRPSEPEEWEAEYLEGEEG